MADLLAGLPFDLVLVSDRRDTITSHMLDTLTLYDTFPVFHADTNYRDSSFYVSGLQMKYTVELVHQSGAIDTVETLVYEPYLHTFITARTIHIANAGASADTVRLRVRGDFANVPDADTLVEFTRESMLDSYPSYGDSTIAVGTGGGFVTPSSGTCLSAIGPYPNPSTTSAENVSVLVHYCTPGTTISVQIYDALANPVGSAVTVTSDEQTWDRVTVPAPASSGSYFIHVTASSSTVTLGYSVY